MGAEYESLKKKTKGNPPPNLLKLQKKIQFPRKSSNSTLKISFKTKQAWPTGGSRALHTQKRQISNSFFLTSKIQNKKSNPPLIPPSEGKSTKGGFLPPQKPLGPRESIQGCQFPSPHWRTGGQSEGRSFVRITHAHTEGFLLLRRSLQPTRWRALGDPWVYVATERG